MFQEIGNKINKLMAKEGISGMKLAKKLGIPASTFKKIRSQEITNPTLATLVPIARYFSVPVEYFLESDSDISIKQHQIPLLSWDEVKHFPNTPPSLYVNVDEDYGAHVFGLSIEMQHDFFPVGSFIVVDTAILPQQQDFVVVSDHAGAHLRQYNNKQPFSAETQIIGVIISYQRESIFKILNTNKE